MARMRHLKPEFFRDAKIAQLGPDAALVYQALWCVADDGGTAPADPVRIWGEMFVRWPAVNLEVVARAVVSLSRCGRLKLYRVGDELYGVIPTFPKHQKPKNPSDFRYPTSDEWLTAEEVQSLLPHGSSPTPGGGLSFPSVVSSQVSGISGQESVVPAPNSAGNPENSRNSGWSRRAVELATATALPYEEGRYLRILKRYVRRDGAETALAHWAEFLKVGRCFDEDGKFLNPSGPMTLLRPERFRDTYEEWKPSTRRPAA